MNDGSVAHFVYSYLPVSETFIYNDITSIRRYRVIVLSARKEKKILYPFENLRSIEDMRFPSNLCEFFMFKFFGRSEFLKKCLLECFLLHTHFGHVGLKLVGIKNELGIPMITNFYGADMPILRSSAKRRVLFENGELFIALSQDMKKDVMDLGCDEEKIKVMDTGIDISKFPFRKRNPGKKIRLLTVARLVEKKGLEYLIRAFARVNDAELTIIGRGPMEQRLKNLASTLGVDDKISFLGTVPYDALPSHYYNSDIFVLPSITDSRGGKDEFSMAMKEAMSTGMPVVSTFHAGIPEVITDGKNGFLAPEKDHIALADKIAYMAENPAVCRRISRAGRKTVEKVYDIRKRAKALEAVYKSYER